LKIVPVNSGFSVKLPLELNTSIVPLCFQEFGHPIFAQAYLQILYKRDRSHIVKINSSAEICRLQHIWNLIRAASARIFRLETSTVPQTWLNDCNGGAHKHYGPEQVQPGDAQRVEVSTRTANLNWVAFRGDHTGRLQYVPYDASIALPHLEVPQIMKVGANFLFHK